MDGFVKANVDMPPVRWCSLAWGDFDDDGDPDLAITGTTMESRRLTEVFRNDTEAAVFKFSKLDAVFVGVDEADCTWADFDGDRDLDLLLAGRTQEDGPVTTLYSNQGGGAFDEAPTSLIALQKCSVAAGDYDADGDIDIAIVGKDASGQACSRVYQNAGPARFEDAEFDLTPVSSGSVAWGDYDNDGDLDLVLAGGSQNGPTTKVYRNEEGNLTDVDALLPGVTSSCSVRWVDFDGDGDLDLCLSGTARGAPAS